MRTITLFFLLLSFQALEAQYVHIFKSKNFQGEHIFIQNDWSCEQDYSLCSSIGSISIPQGWEVWCFTENDFSGTPLRLRDSWSGDDDEAWKWRNRIKSVRIVQKNIEGAPVNFGIALFKERNLEGDHHFISGDIEGENLSDWYYTNSIYVPDGWEVWAYTGSNFSGQTLKLTESWLGTEANAWKWRNQIRSIRIVRQVKTNHFGFQHYKNLGVALFKERNLEGEHLFSDHDWDCEQNSNFCNRIQSIYLPPGYEVWIYSGKNYTGSYRILKESWLGTDDEAWKWRNSIQSIRIVYRGRRYLSNILPYSQNSNPSSQNFVTVYQHDFKGEEMHLYQDWTVGGNNGFYFNDMISSIIVPAGMKIIVYEHANYQGRSLTIRGRWAPPRWDDFWNDRISSIRVVRED